MVGPTNMVSSTGGVNMAGMIEGSTQTETGKRQLFFIIVGLDQSIHITFLLITAQIFDISSGCLASQLLRAFNHVFIGL